ncbi:transcriptional regulator, Spx/MgsR family [Lutibacter agarilyticus]|uniref:Transcriptional regulator, Spx/MgsR family n=1 Tax=Lutibacter agarilyticus TaxID=1109740 RepID=A0A238XDD7_9FLAO|nr:ArsC/Spx/MgsR family protein [Lutibacter agarilyticus]SNR56523.1 transcriptional regulator, Spx/MgsR family [Lutibacter agarilyticus]
MKKIYYLKTCDTCRRILKEMDTTGYMLQNIKTDPITVEQLEAIYSLTNSYEVLFSRRAKKYKEMDLKNQDLSEKDYRQLILDEYTFLKRPVIINEHKVLVGNTKKRVDIFS